MVGGRVFLKRLEDQRVAGFLEDEDLPQRAGVGQDLRLGLGDRRAAVDQDLAGRRVDDVAAGDPALELGGRLGIGRVDLVGFVKRLQDGLVARVLRAHRAQQRHRRELARLVDPHAQRVFLGDLQLDPASALGDDPAGVQLLVARLDLDDEVDAGRAVELADDDALGAVDDELAAADHDRHVTQVDRFLEGRLALVEPEPDVERPAVGQAELAALVGVVARLAQVVVEILELERLVVALDREDLAEDPFQARRRRACRPASRPGGIARSFASGSGSGREPETRRRSGRSSVSWPGMIRRTVVGWAWDRAPEGRRECRRAAVTSPDRLRAEIPDAANQWPAQGKADEISVLSKQPVSRRRLVRSPGRETAASAGEPGHGQAACRPAGSPNALTLRSPGIGPVRRTAAIAEIT